MQTKETDERELEPQQYQRLYWEEDVPLKDVRESVLRKFAYLGSILCLLFFTTGFFIKFPDQIELPFLLKNNRSEQVYRYSQPVYVIEKYINPADVVVKGQPLVRITSAEIVALINTYREAEQNFRNYSLRKALSIESEKEIIKNRMKQNQVNISEAQKDLSILDSTWKSNLVAAEYEREATLKRYEVMKKLYEEKASSKFELMEYEAKKNKAADGLESAKQNYQKARYNLLSLHNKYLIDNTSAIEELQKTDYNLQHDSTYLHDQYTLAKNKIAYMYGDFEPEGGDIILKAGKNGTVSYIFDGDKEVSGGSILLKLITNSSDYYASVSSPPSKIGRLTSNKKVVLKVASFPFYEWGTMKGHIENSSLTPDEKGSFPVKISIDDYGKLRNLTQIGMNGDATIILEERTIYYYFFHHIKRAYYNATKQNTGAKK